MKRNCLFFLVEKEKNILKNDVWNRNTHVAKIDNSTKKTFFWMRHLSSIAQLDVAFSYSMASNLTLLWVSSNHEHKVLRAPIWHFLITNRQTDIALVVTLEQTLPSTAYPLIGAWVAGPPCAPAAQFTIYWRWSIQFPCSPVESFFWRAVKQNIPVQSWAVY